MRASNTAELVFEGVAVPAATHLVGREGDALIHMVRARSPSQTPPRFPRRAASSADAPPQMRNLEIERLGLAAMALGIARRSIEVMNKYAAERVAFGQPINRYGQIQRHIADSCE